MSSKQELEMFREQQLGLAKNTSLAALMLSVFGNAFFWVAIFTAMHVASTSYYPVDASGVAAFAGGVWFLCHVAAVVLMIVACSATKEIEIETSEEEKWVRRSLIAISIMYMSVLWGIAAAVHIIRTNNEINYHKVLKATRSKRSR